MERIEPAYQGTRFQRQHASGGAEEVTIAILATMQHPTGAGGVFEHEPRPGGIVILLEINGILRRLEVIEIPLARMRGNPPHITGRDINFRRLAARFHVPRAANAEKL